MKPLIVANWKCNPPTLKEAKLLFERVEKGLKDIKDVEVVICPPFVYLPTLYVHHQVMNIKLNIKLGAQDCFWEQKGAFTGEVSPTMLKDLGCEYVIIGHSERRKYLNETDGMVNKKLKAALLVGLKPILCVGSKKRGEKGAKEMKAQLERALAGIKKSELKNIIITYEPIWAISTTKGSIVATPENTKEGKIFLRRNLTKLFGKTIAQKVKIIYGGSVDSTNIEDFIKVAQMDGVLIGAASLRFDDFMAAVKTIDPVRSVHEIKSKSGFLNRSRK
ncbi:MAG: triose-phosphate isomerase [Candidatus Nealsonbacteria bacterium CG_4_9_14_3_um_filter_37_13]|uniref:Triosephosphate isomerase n=2 Tax=Candidatus Nealsoniibacteriota TaxID=1817911 RepID=A0A2M7Z5I0_9BACT|nr:MAG: triose-phosphate isomerase [Candidatus Nealsonbacteria bacterium CG_4_9_14_3_um_filter_37_13]